MLTFTQLRERLSQQLGQPLKKHDLDQWVRDGLPFTVVKRQKQFAPQQVAQWMLAHGKATRKPAPPTSPAELPSQVATTRSEAAAALQVNLRTLAEWQTDPTFPGRAGSPGKQDGYYPLAEIVAWRQARFGGDSRSNSDTDELKDLRARKLRLEIDRERVKYELTTGTLLDAQESADFQDRHIYLAKTIFEQMPDQLENTLPATITPKVRAQMRAKIDELFEKAFAALAELCHRSALKADDVIP